MEKPHIRAALSAALLLTAAPAGAQEQQNAAGTPAAATAAVNLPVVVDSVRIYREQKEELERALANQGIPVPAIQLVQTPANQVFDNRAFVNVEFQPDAQGRPGLGRVRVRVTSANGTHTVTSDVTPIAPGHTVELKNLIEGTTYRGEVQVMTQNGAATTNRTHPVQPFTTKALNAEPTVQITRITPGPNSLTVSTQANKPAYYRVRVYSQVANAPGPLLRTVGDEYTLVYGAPSSAAEAAMTREVVVPGLTPAQTYYVAVDAINVDGRTGSSQMHGAQTLARSFGFDGPVYMVVSPERGLVVRWRSSGPADAARLQVPMHGRPGGYSVYPATSSVDKLSHEAVIPYTDVQQVPTPTPAGAPTPLTPASAMTLFLVSGNETQQLQFAMGIEKPENRAWERLSGQQRSDVAHVFRELNGGKTPNLEVLLRSGMKVFAKVAPVILTAL